MEAQLNLLTETPGKLTEAEGVELCRIARRTLEAAILNRSELPINLAELPERLRAPGASFVTLTIGGQLRGCIGTVEPYKPLAEDVGSNAVKSATIDPRFPPMSPDELERTDIEVSVLSELQPLPKERHSDLPRIVRPGVDGVMMIQGWRRGVLLPQVWEKIPNAEAFLDHVCLKAGLAPGAWRDPSVDVYVFQVWAFHERRNKGRLSQ